MNDANLVKYVSRLLEAYSLVSRRVDSLEQELSKLKGNGGSEKKCRVYKMKIAGSKQGNG